MVLNMGMGLLLAALPLREAAHTVEMDAPIATADDGLLVGNGDLSCSIFQAGDEIVFRLGKGDVWDRRMDYSTREKEPVTHAEFVNGMLNEGWVHRTKNKKTIAVATKGTKNEKRMQAVMSGGNAVARDWPYPGPKPTGELRMRLPADLPHPYALRQRLAIEEGVVDLSVTWKNGVVFTAEAVMDPTDNVFSVRWKIDGLEEKQRPVYHATPVMFSLVRHADLHVLDFGREYLRATGHDFFLSNPHFAATKPLPPPQTLKLSDGRRAIEQTFGADPTFPNGFACRLTLTPEMPRAYVFDASRKGSDACLCYHPSVAARSGSVRVTVTTTRDGSLDAPLPRSHAAIAAAAKRAAQRAWSRSALFLPGDPELERMWYAVYHARHCVLRPGTIPPGLFMPSTLGDYSMWDGDYHSNYNYQSIYWGGFTANRLDEEMVGIECTELFRAVGHLRAREYGNFRGSFVPLEAYPIRIEKDYSTAIPRGRMVYMTGWAAVPYWTYYLYTLDRGFLERLGYPAIKDFALFYLDFLKKAPSKDLPPHLKDGKYHAFPSIEEEDNIKSVDTVTDRRQVIAFIRYALYAAIEASKVLDVDADLRAQWQDRLDNLATEPTNRTGYAKHCHLVNSPEFGYDTPVYKPSEALKVEKRTFSGVQSFGHTIRGRIGRMRTNRFNPMCDYDEYREALRYWARPNGMALGMSIDVYGHLGGWTEALSCMAPLQEMMLQSWDGAIRLFPRWPKEKDAAFRDFRAQGAFLVSSEWKGGKIGKTTLLSEKGADCHVHGDWHVTNEATGEAVATTRDEFGRLVFSTIPGGRYSLNL